MKKTLLIALAGLAIQLPHTHLAAQVERLADTLVFYNEFTGMSGKGDFAPFWMTNNRYGLSSNQNDALVWRRSIRREIQNDAGRKWQVGWGFEFSNVFENDTRWVIQELYADIQRGVWRLSVGQKQRPSELLNPALSSGGLATGINARPIPEIRIEVPDFWTIPGTRDWLALRGRFGFGMFTDNKWQRDFTDRKHNYVQNYYYHTKAGFLRVGNEEKFPVTVVGGLEMNTQFGGTLYKPDGSKMKFPKDLKTIWNVIVPGGEDPTDGEYSNRVGNIVGAWHLAINYRSRHADPDKRWGVKAYGEHYFEDESELFWQYGWKDFMLGLEVNLPKNPIVSTVLYEYLTTKHQAGSIYHDHTQQIPDQISALDNYYNHGLYGGWQHAGYAMGTPLLISPIYNSDGNIYFYHNRIQAHHAGLSGNPTSELAYRLLFSYEKSWGTYGSPLPDPQEGWTAYAEAFYKPHWLRNCGLGIAYGHNGGELLGKSNAVQLSFTYNLRFHTK